MTSKRLLIRDLMLCVNYIDEKSPRVWLHGHTYPTDEYGNTRIEYVFRYSGALTEFFVAS